jgi:hypothetical protein
MSFELNTAITFSEYLLSIAIILQSIELLQIRSSWTEQGVWRWSTLQKSSISSLYNTIFCTQGFTAFLVLRILASITTWMIPFDWNTIHAGLDLFLFLSTWLISVRWRGLFNGGSDSMTIVVSAGLFFTRVTYPFPAISKYGLAYIALQVTLSYFIAGLVKFKNPEWRNGSAMPVFLKTPRYDSPPALIRNTFEKPAFSSLISWTIITIECLFPLAWLSSSWCIPFLLIALVFHLLNYWIFGLNRFVWAWLSAYPALYFWSQHT